MEAVVALRVPAYHENAADDGVEPTVDEDHRVGAVPAHKDEVKHPGHAEDHKTHKVKGLEQY